MTLRLLASFSLHEKFRGKKNTFKQFRNINIRVQRKNSKYFLLAFTHQNKCLVDDVTAGNKSRILRASIQLPNDEIGKNPAEAFLNYFFGTLRSFHKNIFLFIFYENDSENFLS
jgi:hypothetical protein